MHQLSDRITGLAESATLKMAGLARQLRRAGKDVINLSIGEPDFDTPQHIKDAAKQAIDEGYTKYTPVPGFLDLRQAISHKFKRDNGLEYSPDQIVVSTGGKQSLANLALCLLNPGDEAILPIPYWVSYEAQILLAKGKVVRVATQLSNNFKLQPEELEAAITPKTKAFIFSSPSNPTGSAYTKEELYGLAKVLAKYPNIYIISDEIYEHINYVGKHESIGQFAELKDRVITVNGLSKGFAMTGWRLGYIGAPLEIAKACGKLQGQFTSGTCSVTQRAAIEALTGTLEPTYRMCAAFQKRRDLLLDLLNDIPHIKTYVPEGAFYVFPDVSHYFGKQFDGQTIDNVDELCMFLLNEMYVSVVTGKAFGNENCLRISYAASEDTLREAAKRIKAGLAKLN